MLNDAREIIPGTEISGDLCIIGAGPAGISIAREFLGTPLKVLLLESGGMEPDAKTQSLYEGKSVGLAYPLSASRGRYFGGSSNLWWGNSRPLEAIDFEKRDWIPYSGWPFDKEYLRPFYERAMKVIPLGKYEDFEWDGAKDKVAYSRLEFSSGNIETKIIQEAGRLNFREMYGPELDKAENIQTLLWANAVEIVPEDNGRKVSHVRVKTLSGNEFKVSSRAYVLAASGIENARILLNSNSVQKNGLGNQNDLVGRFFMEHPVIDPHLLPSTPELEFKLYDYYVRKPIGGNKVWCMLTPSDKYQRSRKQVTAGACFHGGISSAVQSLDELKRFALGTSRENFGEHLKNVLTDLDGVATYVYEKKWKGLERWEMKHELYLFTALLEMLPTPDNRVTLSGDKDALGQRRSELHMKLTDFEKEKYLELFDMFGREFGAEGYGRMKMEFLDDPDWGIKFWDHQMGTTRMHDDPKQGVTDANQQIHGISNLYAAGSSVFPTGGFAPPTLTIVALSLRLADHLKGTLK